MEFAINGYAFTVSDSEGAVDVHVCGLIERFPTHRAAFVWIRSFGGALA